MTRSTRDKPIDLYEHVLVGDYVAGEQHNISCNDGEIITVLDDTRGNNGIEIPTTEWSLV